MAGYDREDARPKGSIADYTDREVTSPRDEYSITAQIEALSNELGVLQDMISQVEKKFGPVLIEGDMMADGGEKDGMDRRSNSHAVEALMSHRAFVRGQTQRLMYLVERAQI